MHHVAIMKKQWGLIPQIINGVKTVESRWYKNRIAPWNKLHPGDIIFFKNSGEKVRVKATVTKIEQYEIESNKHAIAVMSRYAYQDLGSADVPKEVKDYIANKRYAVFVHFSDVEEIKPFDIDKTGFGMQSAWLVADNIAKLRR